MDIYNRDIQIGEPLAADAIRLLFKDGNNVLVQSIEAQYDQNVSRLYELGSAKTYFFVGRTAGQMQFKKFIGPQGPSSQFIREYGDACNVNGNHITLLMYAGCESANIVGSLKATGCLVTSVAFAMTAQESLIGENLKLMFVSLDNIGNGAAAA